MVYLYFEKAFDKIPHPDLLYKLWRLGITGPLWLWLKAYLTDCTHFVSVEGYLSDPLPVHSGVSEGSVIGPLLFLIYINYLPNARCTSFTVFKLEAVSQHQQMCCFVILSLLEPIKCVEKYTDLGILVTNNLTWSNHINTICSSAYQSFHLIRHSFPFHSPKVRKLMASWLIRFN